MAGYVKRYNPERKSDWNYGGSKWRLSRSKIELFTECPRCFYLDNKLGTGRPRGPAFTLNIAVDALLKREFDAHRLKKTAHPLMKKYKVDAVPFQHELMDVWRENFKGREYFDEATGIAISGAIDGVWVKPSGALIVVDYKATSKNEVIETLADSSWEQQYKRQMGVYQWLLRKNGFEVDTLGYFVYANADGDKEAFDGKLEFDITLVPCEGESKWIDDTIPRIKETLESDRLPPSENFANFVSTVSTPQKNCKPSLLRSLHRKPRPKALH